MTQEGSAPSRDLEKIFLAHLDGGPRAVSPDGLEERLHLLVTTARAAWPMRPLDPAMFVRHVAERVPPNEPVEGALEQMHTTDLYLACAGAYGVRGAVEQFQEQYSPTIAKFLKHINPSPTFADEVRQLVLDKLFVPDEGAPLKIMGYSGRGPLASWVGVVAQRIAFSLLRQEGSRERVNEEVLAEALPFGDDPELDYLKVRYRAEFREAFLAAVAALTKRERLVLRLFLVNRLSHEKIGALLRVHQGTVTRWIASARESIASNAQRFLRERLNVSTSELESLAHLVGSQLDLSLTRWLREAPE